MAIKTTSFLSNSAGRSSRRPSHRNSSTPFPARTTTTPTWSGARPIFDDWPNSSNPFSSTRLRVGRGLCGLDSPILPRAEPHFDERIYWRLPRHLVQCASAEFARDSRDLREKRDGQDGWGLRVGLFPPVSPERGTGDGSRSVHEQCGLIRIIHECRREAFETEARRGFSQVRPTQRTLSPSRRPNEKSPTGREDRTTEQVFM